MIIKTKTEIQMKSNSTENTLFTTLMITFFVLMVISFFYKPAIASDMENTTKAVVTNSEQVKTVQEIPRVIIVGKRLHKNV
jgi:hypothetical protein